jgi:hypothetical protein
MVDERWLKKTLKSNITQREKKKLLLTQIGYLRINIFTEYFERVNLLREKEQLDQAIELMNQHAEIASIFISKKSQSPFIKRLKKLFSIRSTEPLYYLEQWRTFHERWLKQKNSNEFDGEKRMEEFEKLKMAFLELYTFSFSIDNFPPLGNRRSDH